ncbi:MAG: site-specific integrase [Bacteroidia bacterium]|nr:site-specific integrase [Bacteroidia bacterium]
MITKTSTVLDTRKIKKDSTYPVKLRITFERKQVYYTIPEFLTELEFRKVMYGLKLTKAEKDLKIKITAYENKAIGIIKNLPFFSWSVFDKQYYINRGTKDTINGAFAEYAAELRSEGRIGTAVSYECAQSSLLKFDKDLRFSSVTPDCLRKYENWMLSKDKSITTVGIYMRSLRTIINNAIHEGLLTKDFYPFGKKKYEIPTGNNVKKALTLKDIGTIYNYKPIPESVDERMRDYWLFMYLCNGINVKDMCLLKFENLKGEVLEFERAKTARTKRNVEPIRVVLIDDLKAIIKKWGNERGDNKGFIFPILTKGITPERERQLIQQVTGVINDHMKAIAKVLEIDTDCTTYAARHSFATVLQRSGVSTEFISEALGHSNLRTTQNYLPGFEDDSKKETIKALTAFKNILPAKDI